VLRGTDGKAQLPKHYVKHRAPGARILAKPI
jgi:hypothetical protein